MGDTHIVKIIEPTMRRRDVSLDTIIKNVKKEQQQELIMKKREIKAAAKMVETRMKLSRRKDPELAYYESWMVEYGYGSHPWKVIRVGKHQDPFITSLLADASKRKKLRIFTNNRLRRMR